MAEVDAIVTQANGSRRGTVLPLFVCLSVCVSVCLFLRMIPKNNAARVTQLDIEIIQDEAWKTIYFGVKRSRSRVLKALPAWVFALL